MLQYHLMSFMTLKEYSRGVIMKFSEKNLAVENFNFTQFDTILTLVNFVLNVSSFIIAAILWLKFDFSFYYVVITLLIIFNTLCMILYYSAHRKSTAFFKFLTYSKKILYKISKIYPVIFLITIGYFFKNIVNFYLRNINFTDFLIFAVSMVCFVFMYRYKQEYELQILSVISEDDNYIELEQQDEKKEKELINEIPKPEQEEVLNQSAPEEIKQKGNRSSKNKTNKRKTVKNIDDIFNLFRSIMPPEEAKKIPFKEFFYDYIAKEYSEHDFVGYNFNLRFKEGKLFRIYKNGKEKHYEYNTLEQYFCKYCKLAQL